VPTGSTVLWITVGFGAGIAVVLTGLQAIRLRRGGVFSSGFRRVIALIFVIEVATGVTLVSGVSGDDKAALFALLGTVAGYSVAQDPRPPGRNKPQATGGEVADDVAEIDDG
jgi:hypothetical protein